MEMNAALVLISILGFTIASYFLFINKKIFLFMSLGLVLSLIGSGIFVFPWKSYARIARILYPIFILLALVFFIIAITKMSKELTR